MVFKKNKTPHYSEKDINEIKKARKLYSTLKGKTIFMDDEKYFTFSATNMPQNSFLYSSGKKKRFIPIALK